jgi:hypothetical protein
MPKVFYWNGYVFFFYSNEGSPLERIHIHARKGGQVAKFFIEPELILESSWGMSSKELNELERQIEKNKELIRSKWDEYFNKRSNGK